MGSRVKSIAVFPVTEKGATLALRLAGRFEDLVIVPPARLRNGRLMREVRSAFKDFDGLVFICASGIAVRAVAPLLRGKHIDPAIIVMDERGRFVISLLSGHLGGANALAREIAHFLKATPVITTGTDVAGLPCIEDMAQRFDCVIEDFKRIKAVNSAILNGGKVSIVDGDRKRLNALKKAYGKAGVFIFKRRFSLNRPSEANILISSGSTYKMPKEIAKRTLILRPREFVVGIGCKRGVSIREIDAACKRVFKRAGLSMRSIRNLATIDIKADESGLNAFANKLGLKIEYLSAKDLNKKAPSGRPSRFVLENTGAAGVSHPAALISSGAERLWIKKQKEKNVTIALARAPFTS